MNRLLSITSLITLLTACGGGGDGGDAVSVTTTDDSGAFENPIAAGTLEDANEPETLGMQVDNSGGLANIPTTVSSSATSMSATVVPDGFSYNPVLEQLFVVDIRGYSVSPAYITVYGEFTENDDGTFTAHYNSQIVAASLENGQTTLNYVSSDSQFYVLAEVWFYDGTNPVQKRIPNTESSWVW
ncbi:hypothetical protein A1OO_14360 [Enterovibrio norvegicus FF-33]|uniref:hypothetical protein n=1 Tax=Enterovibrio norvegicus TaxID=188144 RepID=UPI00031429C0|nr:hypothetical protein [Enterovibrio norvegicus]OEE66944.1 hypothetical protein A1OO_14360 [Enterovibrio norvegicus FF-33]